MEILSRLQELGYEPRVEGDQIKLIWTRLEPPDSEVVGPLIEELRARKQEIIVDKLLSDSLERIARGYIPGSIDWCKAQAPGLWARIREAEHKVNEVALRRDIKALDLALRELEGLWAELKRIRESKPWRGRTALSQRSRRTQPRRSPSP
jgi:hypothetical protein